MAFETVIWLSHRLGPVLSAKFLSRNLLRMLNLCYIGKFAEVPSRHPDQEVRVSRQRIEGDLMAENVLEALTGMVTLYGEQLILVQYLPYAWDLLMICRFVILQALFLDTWLGTHTSTLSRDVPDIHRDQADFF